MASKQKRGGSPPLKQKQSQTIQLLNKEESTFELIIKEIKEIKLEIKRSELEIKGIIQRKIDEVNQSIYTVVKDLSDVILHIDRKLEAVVSDVDNRFKVSDLKVEEIQNLQQRMENEIIMMQFRTMEQAIRIKGMKEDSRDLKKICADALAILLKVDPEVVLCKINKVYRVNSHVAMKKQIPRDVVIYFTERRIRNDILQSSYVSKVQVDGAEVGIYKELPPRMLKDRRDFGFLVAELKQQNIQFRWDVPRGVTLRLRGVRYRLNTITKAEEFYYSVLKAESSSQCPSSPLDKEEIEAQVKQSQVERIATEAQGVTGGVVVDPFTPLEGSLLDVSSEFALTDIEGRTRS